MTCEMCGSEANTVATLIEGVELKVCQKCASYGTAVKRTSAPSFKASAPVRHAAPEKEVIQTIKTNYSELIREKREKLGLKQEEFAKFLSEKESMIHKIESGAYTPSLDLARKIERQLGITLVEEKEIESQHLKAKNESFTIGDILKVK